MTNPQKAPAQLILHNGHVTTMDEGRAEATAVAIRDGLFVAVGSDSDVFAHRGEDTVVVDLRGRRVIPGLNDSHTHPIRGGLTYNLELRWEGVSSVADAIEMVRIQAENTPPPQWVRVIGGWSEYQFREKRMPTLDELNQAAPHTPVIVLHLYGRAMVNRAGLRALGYDTAPPTYDRGLVEMDDQGHPTGLLIADPSALLLYKTISEAPSLPSVEDKKNSTRQFMRELNRLGVTSAIDAGGGGQNYPEDYGVIQELHTEGKLTVRMAYHLFAQTPGEEYSDYARWVDMTYPGDGDSMLKVVGAGENLVWSAADFENFLKPRPDLVESMEEQLGQVVGLLASRQWPFRIHATYDESIARFLDVFERVHAHTPIDQNRWIIDHAETISERSIDRIAALGGGIAVQHRMAFQGEYFVDQYGVLAAQQTPPIRKMLNAGVPVGAGTDATRVASYNPWVALYWLTTGRTLGGTPLYGDDNTLSRHEALTLWTRGSAWFSSEDDVKGTIAPGQYADLAVLSADFFTVPDEVIKNLESVLTVVDGRVVYAAEEFGDLGPEALPVRPDWSPVARFGGHQRFGSSLSHAHGVTVCRHGHVHSTATLEDRLHVLFESAARWWGANPGCACFAF